MRWGAASLALLLVGLLLNGLSAPMGAAAEHPGFAPPLYLILPFENIAEDPSLDWLSTGLALSLGEHLRGLGATVVDDEERAYLLAERGIPPGASLTLASVLELGRRVRNRSGARQPVRIVLGRFNVTDGELTLSARAIDMAEERAGSWLSREGRLRDLLTVQADLAKDLAHEDESLPRRGAWSTGVHREKTPLLAFETYCRAMAESDSGKRLDLLRRAIREFPDYGRAAFQAASLLAKGERWDEAAEMIGGISTVPHPYGPEFHLLAAAVALRRDEPAQAAQAARRALEFTDSARGHLLLARAHLALGDRETALEELDKAMALDPAEREIRELREAAEGRPEAAERLE